MNYSFDCVFYYVSELDRAIRFYRDVLGLQLKSQDFVARFEIDGVLAGSIDAHVEVSIWKLFM